VKTARSERHFRLAGLAGKAVLHPLLRTVRFRTEGAEHYTSLRARAKPVLFVFWHGRLLPLVYLHRNQGIVVLVSEHADGEYISRVIHRFGFATTRGSSTRGGTRGLRGLIRAARDGRDLAITPDGPRGPAEVFKPGAIVAAQLAGAVIVPMGVAITRAWAHESWDRFLIPKPFSTVQVMYGTPVRVPRDAEQDEVRSLAEQVEQALRLLNETAERRLGLGNMDSDG
jgi:lysophospholipid acyltransferase (LPLAT)-like uncharacterized protein